MTNLGVHILASLFRLLVDRGALVHMLSDVEGRSFSFSSIIVFDVSGLLFLLSLRRLNVAVMFLAGLGELLFALNFNRRGLWSGVRCLWTFDGAGVRVNLPVRFEGNVQVFGRPLPVSTVQDFVDDARCRVVASFGLAHLVDGQLAMSSYLFVASMR